MITALISSTLCFGQAKDSLAKKDTVVKLGYVIPQRDTVTIAELYYLDGYRVKKCSPGYIVREQNAVTFDGKNFQWLEQQPRVIGALNNKKRPVKPIDKPVK